MMRSSSETLLRASALTLLAAACAAPASAQTTLRPVTEVNEVDVRYQGVRKFGALVGAKTAGRVKVEV